MVVHLVHSLTACLPLCRKERGEGVRKNSDGHCNSALRSAVHTHDARLFSERVVKRAEIFVGAKVVKNMARTNMDRCVDSDIVSVWNSDGHYLLCLLFESKKTGP